MPERAGRTLGVFLRYLRIAVVTPVLVAIYADAQPSRQSAALDTTGSALETIHRYETLRKEKAEALALSFVVPGGAIFASGRRPELGATLGFIEGLSIGTIVYTRLQIDAGKELQGDRTMMNIFTVVLIAAKITEVCEGFALIDDCNRDLWDRLNRPASGEHARRSPFPHPSSGIRVGFSIPL
jgi:hypothetical protein